MLLPSEELAELADRVDICLSGRVAPKGCDIRYRQMYWLMVFDTKGELLSACRLSDQLSKYNKLGMSVPESFVAIVDEGLAATPSLEQLERSYLSERGSAPAFDALREKVDAMDGVGQMRVSQFLSDSAPKVADPALSRARSVLVEAAACSRQVINHAAFATLRTNIEDFLADHPGHDLRDDIVDKLVNVGLKYTFDLSAKCRSYAEAWASRGGDDFSELSKLVMERSATDLERSEAKLREMKPKAYGRLRIQARLGVAQATLAGLDASKSRGVMRPIHAEWRREANTKISQPKPDRK